MPNSQNEDTKKWESSLLSKDEYEKLKNDSNKWWEEHQLGIDFDDNSRQQRIQ